MDEPPFSVREGELIRDGFDGEVDRLRTILHGGKGIVVSMEAAEKEKTEPEITDVKPKEKKTVRQPKQMQRTKSEAVMG